MGKYKSVNTGDCKAMASAETKQKESNMVTTMETKQSEYAGVITTAEMEMSDYKRCKITRTETKVTMPKKLITSLGFFPITSVEINEGSSIQFYINLDSSVIDPECRDTIRNCIESQDKAKRMGWTWHNARVELSMRLHVIIDSNWNVSSSKLEVHYQDKKQNDISGKLFFVNIVREHTLKEIIADVIRARLFQ